MLAILVIPGITLAQTQSAAQLQVEIDALLAQVASLQAQINGQSGASNAIWCHSFNSNLSIGMSGSDVTALQTGLQKDGESVTVNGSFDDQTASAVSGFQQKYASTILAPHGLSNGTGYAGRATRAKLNALFGCAGGNPIGTPVPIGISTSTPCAITFGSAINCNPMPVPTTSTLPIPPIVCPAWGCNGPTPITPTQPINTSTSTTVTASTDNAALSGSVMSSNYSKTIAITNTGNVPAQWTATISPVEFSLNQGNGVMSQLTGAWNTIAPGSNSEFSVIVTPPANLIGGRHDLWGSNHYR